MKNMRRLVLLIVAVIGTMLAVRDGFGYLNRRLIHQRNMVWQNERLPELRNTMRDAAPIIAAIRKYEKDYGRTPGRLQELVPRYLSAVPSPSKVSRSINWEYVRGNTGKWTLGVRVSRYFCSRCVGSYGDTFAYHSSGNYSEMDYGGALEKVDNWGYFHK